ncbi:MAG: pyridoxal phosphate-dependent aminotransferase [Phycisphaerae bacterium]
MDISQRVQQMAESATLAVTNRAAQMRAAGQDVISFGAGEPDFDTPAHIKEAAFAALRDGQTKYPKPSHGLKVAKEAVQAKLKRENGLNYAPEQIIITAGSKMGCQLACLARLNPGDEAIVPVPYWVSYPELIKLAGAKPIFVRGDEKNNFCITAQQMANAITDKTRLMIFNSPSNPGGFTYTADQVRALAEVVAGKDILVVSDEMYDRLILNDQAFVSFAATNEQAYGQTLTVNGGSKTYAMTGWRVGYSAGPARIVKAMAKLQSQGTSGAATATQIALAAALNGDQSCVEAMRDEYKRRAKVIHTRLSELPGMVCQQPTGGMFAFPNATAAYKKLGVSGSLEFCERAITDAKVAIVPGIAFGSDDHLRFSFACSLETIDEGMDRLAKLLG